MPDTENWTAACDVDELWEGDMIGVRVEDTPILLVKVDGEIRAYRNRCPHQEWPLDQGDLDGDVLTCSAHLWQFEVRTGRGLNPSDCALAAFPVRVEEGKAWVCLPG